MLIGNICAKSLYHVLFCFFIFQQKKNELNFLTNCYRTDKIFQCFCMQTSNINFDCIQIGLLNCDFCIFFFVPVKLDSSMYHGNDFNSQLTVFVQFFHAYVLIWKLVIFAYLTVELIWIYCSFWIFYSR